jgi:hypothetical protein
MRSQKGFGALEALLVVVLICVVGGAGWYVWNTKVKGGSSKLVNSAAISFTSYTLDTRIEYGSGIKDGSVYKLQYYKNSAVQKDSSGQKTLVSPEIQSNLLPLEIKISQTVIKSTGLKSGQPKLCSEAKPLVFSVTVKATNTQANLCGGGPYLAENHTPLIYLANFSDDKYNYQVTFSQFIDQDKYVKDKNYRALTTDKRNLPAYDNDLRTILSSIDPQ